MDQQPNKHTYKTAPALPGTEGRSARQVTDHIDAEAQAKHEESVKRYPELTLSKDEYVITVIRRHPIGLVYIWGFIGLLVFLTFGALAWYSVNRDFIAKMFLLGSTPPDVISMAPLAFIFLGFIALGGFIATIIYIDNRFYLTNESVFQFLRTGILQQKMQVINLINVEDASHEQNGILQNLFNYGTLRLSTQGQETVYHFYFVGKPRRIVALVNDASEQAVRRLEGFPKGEY